MQFHVYTESTVSKQTGKTNFQRFLLLSNMEDFFKLFLEHNFFKKFLTLFTILEDFLLYNIASM
jgi:hypothetical protein